jgi:hypothetical protein
MRFTVVWMPSVEKQLTRIWVRALLQRKDVAALTQASDRIDQLLRSSSHVRSNDTAGVYQLTVWPLRVVFSVSPDDRMVTVRQVTYLG